jgi:hypothetical protein
LDSAARTAERPIFVRSGRRASSTGTSVHASLATRATPCDSRLAMRRGYRLPLYERLRQRGVPVRFVGSQARVSLDLRLPSAVGGRNPRNADHRTARGSSSRQAARRLHGHYNRRARGTARNASLPCAALFHCMRPVLGRFSRHLQERTREVWARLAPNFILLHIGAAPTPPSGGL